MTIKPPISQKLLAARVREVQAVIDFVRAQPVDSVLTFAMQFVPYWEALIAAAGSPTLTAEQRQALYDLMAPVRASVPMP
jgi:hypothetical protein